MERVDGDSQQSNENQNRELRNRIRERDDLTPPPAERAAYILELLQAHGKELNNWDILCFCVEYLGSQILIYPWLSAEALRLITTRVYEAHYWRDEIPESGIK